MAAFAQIDQSNIVIRIDSVADAVVFGAQGVENEALGVALLKEIHGNGTEWVQTSETGAFRGKYANRGDIWDPQAQVFVAA